MVTTHDDLIQKYKFKAIRVAEWQNPTSYYAPTPARAGVRPEALRKPVPPVYRYIIPSKEVPEATDDEESDEEPAQDHNTTSENDTEHAANVSTVQGDPVASEPQTHDPVDDLLGELGLSAPLKSALKSPTPAKPEPAVVAVPLPDVAEPVIDVVKSSSDRKSKTKSKAQAWSRLRPVSKSAKTKSTKAKEPEIKQPPPSEPCPIPPPAPEPPTNEPDILADLLGDILGPAKNEGTHADVAHTAPAKASTSSAAIDEVLDSKPAATEEAEIQAEHGQQSDPIDTQDLSSSSPVDEEILQQMHGKDSEPATAAESITVDTVSDPLADLAALVEPPTETVEPQPDPLADLLDSINVPTADAMENQTAPNVSVQAEPASSVAEDTKVDTIDPLDDLLQNVAATSRPVEDAGGGNAAPTEITPSTPPAQDEADGDTAVPDTASITTSVESEDKHVSFAPGTPEPKPTTRRKKILKDPAKHKRRASIIANESTPSVELETPNAPVVDTTSSADIVAHEPNAAAQSLPGADKAIKRNEPPSPQTTKRAAFSRPRSSSKSNGLLTAGLLVLAGKPKTTKSSKDKASKKRSIESAAIEEVSATTADRDDLGVDMISAEEHTDGNIAVHDTEEIVSDVPVDGGSVASMVEDVTSGDRDAEKAHASENRAHHVEESDTMGELSDVVDFEARAIDPADQTETQSETLKNEEARPGPPDAILEPLDTFDEPERTAEPNESKQDKDATGADTEESHKDDINLEPELDQDSDGITGKHIDDTLDRVDSVAGSHDALPIDHDSATCILDAATTDSLSHEDVATGHEVVADPIIEDEDTQNKVEDDADGAAAETAALVEETAVGKSTVNGADDATAATLPVLGIEDEVADHVTLTADRVDNEAVDTADADALLVGVEAAELPTSAQVNGDEKRHDDVAPTSPDEKLITSTSEHVAGPAQVRETAVPPATDLIVEHSTDIAEDSTKEPRDDDGVQSAVLAVVESPPEEDESTFASTADEVVTQVVHDEKHDGPEAASVVSKTDNHLDAVQKAADALLTTDIDDIRKATEQAVSDAEDIVTVQYDMHSAIVEEASQEEEVEAQEAVATRHDATPRSPDPSKHSASSDSRGNKTSSSRREYRSERPYHETRSGYEEPDRRRRRDSKRAEDLRSIAEDQNLATEEDELRRLRREARRAARKLAEAEEAARLARQAAGVTAQQDAEARRRRRDHRSSDRPSARESDKTLAQTFVSSLTKGLAGKESVSRAGLFVRTQDDAVSRSDRSEIKHEGREAKSGRRRRGSETSRSMSSKADTMERRSTTERERTARTSPKETPGKSDGRSHRRHHEPDSTRRSDAGRGERTIEAKNPGLLDSLFRYSR